MSRRAGSNFHAGFLLLPREKRRAMEALYAFMRHTDDLADDLHAGPSAARGPGGMASGTGRSSDEAARGIAGEASGRVPRSEGERRLSDSAVPHSAFRATPPPSSYPLPCLDPARPGRRRPAVPHSPRTSLRGDRRRGDGPGRPALRDVRRVAAVLRARGVGRGAGVHSHLGIPRAGGVRAGPAGGHRPATDQHPPRPEGRRRRRPRLPAAGRPAGSAATRSTTCWPAWPTSDFVG